MGEALASLGVVLADLSLLSVVSLTLRAQIVLEASGLNNFVSSCLLLCHFALTCHSNVQGLALPLSNIGALASGSNNFSMTAKSAPPRYVLVHWWTREQQP